MRHKAGTPMADRLAARSNVDEGGCHLWVGALSTAGYAQLKVGGKTIYAHRASYETHVGPVPDGLQLDHLCRVRRCINPAHLQPVTNRVNTLRGDCGRVNAERMLSRTHCINGHPYTEKNTYVRRAGNRSYRDCRACGRERMRDRRGRRPS